MRLSLFNSSE